MKREKGSVLVEATFILPVVILVFLAFGLFIRYFVTYETLQHGMYEITREMSAYYYVYAAMGFEETSNGIAKEANNAQENLDMLAKPINVTADGITATMASIKAISDQLSRAHGELGSSSIDPQALAENAKGLEGSINELFMNGNALKESLPDTQAALELIVQNPLETVTYLIKFSGGKAFSWAQNTVMGLLGKALMGAHVPGGDLDRYMESHGLSDYQCAMAWNDSGSGDVEMLATYVFHIRLFGGYEFPVIQKTTTKGWGLGV